MSPLGKQTQVLLMGRVGSRQPQEPIAWTNITPAGGRVFYTSLGHPQEFENQDFQRMLLNAVYWAAGLSVPREAPKPVR
jgi:type 1 glutamine amidotransferase